MRLIPTESGLSSDTARCSEPMGFMLDTLPSHGTILTIDAPLVLAWSDGMWH